MFIVICLSSHLFTSRTLNINATIMNDCFKSKRIAPFEVQKQKYLKLDLFCPIVSESFFLSTFFSILLSKDPRIKFHVEIEEHLSSRTEQGMFSACFSMFSTCFEACFRRVSTCFNLFQRVSRLCHRSGPDNQIVKKTPGKWQKNK